MYFKDELISMKNLSLSEKTVKKDSSSSEENEGTGDNRLMHSKPSANTKLSSKSEVRAFLQSRFNVDIVEKVLEEYSNETEPDKLVFLAEGFAFDL